MDQPFVYHTSPFDHPAAVSTSFPVAIGEQAFDITPLPSGEMPKYILVAAGNEHGFAVAVGDSNIDSSTDPQFWVGQGVDMVCLNVLGMTTVSVDYNPPGGTPTTAALTMSILGDF